MPWYMIVILAVGVLKLVFHKFKPRRSHKECVKSTKKLEAENFAIDRAIEMKTSRFDWTRHGKA